GDLLSRLVSDVDALQNLHLRGVGPAAVALVAGTVSVAVAAALLPEAAIVLAAGLVPAAILVPAVTVAASRWSGRQEPGLRGELSAELVEILRGAPELVAYGADGERLQRVADVEARLGHVGRKGAFADGVGDALRLAITGATVAAVLMVAGGAH